MGTEPVEISALQRLIRYGTDRDLQRFFLLLRPPELADILERLDDDDERLRVIRLMGAPLASEVLREMEDQELDEILEDLPPAQIAEIVHESYSDDAADLLAALEPEKAERALQNLEEEEREELRELLAYQDDTAGGLMQTELIQVPEDATVAEAIDQVRALSDEVGEVHQVFVVDADNRLVGSLSPTDLLVAAPEKPVAEILEKDPVAVSVDLDQEKLAEIVREHDLAAVPVVDEERRLVGQVLHDDVADVIQEEAEEDIAQMAGLDAEELRAGSVLRSVRSRAPWLVPAFGGGLLASVILATMEEPLREHVIIMAFLPVVIGMAGNVAAQAATITVRALALGRDVSARIVIREGLTGLLLGALFGALLFGYTLLTRDDGGDMAALYALTLGLAILATIALGATLGTLVPLLLSRAGVDPALAASPFVMVANDILGCGVLILVAHNLGLF